MLENRASSSLLLTLILYPVSLMLVFPSSLYYMAKTLTIAGEMLPPCSSLSHDINMIVLNMHPHTWMRLTKLQQLGRHLFLYIVNPFF